MSTEYRDDSFGAARPLTCRFLIRGNMTDPAADQKLWDGTQVEVPVFLTVQEAYVMDHETRDEFDPAAERLIRNGL